MTLRAAQPTPASGNDAPVTLFVHCQNVYRRMHSQATLRPDPNMDPETATEADNIVVWEGMLTRFITGEMNLSVPYYTFVTQALKGMGCIRQLRRGGNTAPSMWQLIKEPTEEEFTLNNPDPVNSSRVRKGKQAQLEDMIMNLNQRLLVLEKAFEAIIEEEAS